MKKLILFMIPGLILCGFVSAQIDVGIMGGLNINRAKADVFIKPEYNYKLTTLSNLNTGFHFGLFSQIKVFDVLIQPELIFTSLQNELEYEDLTSNKVKKISQEFNMLDIPVLVLLKYKIFKMEAGPVGSILLEEGSFLYDEIGYRQKYNIFTLGYQAGLGVDISKISFDIRYEGHLISKGDIIEIGEEEFNNNSSTQQVILSVGVFF